MSLNNSPYLFLAASLCVAAACTPSNTENSEQPENNMTSNANTNQVSPNQSSNSNNSNTSNNTSTNTSTNNTSTGNNTAANTSAGNNNTAANNTSTDECQDTTIYADADGDGQAPDGAMTKTVCLKSGEAAEAGYARETGDCDDSDPLQFTGSDGICGDYVDDDCDASDEACPESQPAQLDIPDWDCTGTPPANVVAYAQVGEQKYFSADSCFFFFEASKDLFYVRLKGFERQSACTTGNGCCAEYGGYDNRMYAFTCSDADPCEDITISESGGGQPVSNTCRKYLFQMNATGDNAYSFVAYSIDTLRERLEAFDTIEVACVRDTTLSSTAFPFGTLLTTPLMTNESYQPK